MPANPATPLDPTERRRISRALAGAVVSELRRIRKKETPMNKRAITVGLALAGLLTVQGIVLADDDLASIAEPGETVTVNYGDGILPNYDGIRMENPRIDYQDSNADGIVDQVRASAAVTVNSKNGSGTREAIIDLAELNSGSTYTIDNGVWFAFYSYNQSPPKTRRFTEWVNCDPSASNKNYAVIMQISTNLGRVVADRSQNVTIPVDCPAG